MKKLVLLLALLPLFGSAQSVLPCYTTEMYQNSSSLFSQTGTTLSYNAKGAAVIRIPVVVHIIHDGVPNSPVNTGDPLLYEDNLPEANILRQIDQLNKDFNRLNEDANQTVDAFKPIAANVQIEFVLAKKDPVGNASNGIDRVMYPGFSHAGFATNQEIETVIKPFTVWDPSRYFNIWTIRFTETTGSFALLGYAQFPDSSGLGGMPADNSTQSGSTDGVVINPIVFGTTGAEDYFSNNNRTLTHEIGHSLGLRHIWGDGGCEASDFTDDTPTADGSSSGCDVTRTTCAGLNMTQNYMDYTNGNCQNLFSEGQKTRMLAVMQRSPRRKELPNSDALQEVTSGVNNTSAKSAFSVYPNPTTGNLAITPNETDKSSQIEIFSAIGIKLQTVTLLGPTNVDVSELSPGMYYIKYGVHTQSFIKF